MASLTMGLATKRPFTAERADKHVFLQQKNHFEGGYRLTVKLEMTVSKLMYKCHAGKKQILC